MTGKSRKTEEVEEEEDVEGRDGIQVETRRMEVKMKKDGIWGEEGGERGRGGFGWLFRQRRRGKRGERWKTHWNKSTRTHMEKEVGNKGGGGAGRGQVYQRDHIVGGEKRNGEGFIQREEGEEVEERGRRGEKQDSSISHNSRFTSSCLSLFGKQRKTHTQTCFSWDATNF